MGPKERKVLNRSGIQIVHRKAWSFRIDGNTFVLCRCQLITSPDRALGPGLQRNGTIGIDGEWQFPIRAKRDAFFGHHEQKGNHVTPLQRRTISVSERRGIKEATRTIPMKVDVKRIRTMRTDLIVAAHGRGRHAGALRQRGGGEGKCDECCKKLEGFCHDEEER